MSAGTDLSHIGEPVLGGRRWFEGRVILTRCRCTSIIWRTAERFIWQHSTPSRAERIAS